MIKAWQRSFDILTRSWVGPLGLSIASFACWLITVHDANFSKMGLLGLVTLLKWPFFVGLTLLALGFASEVVRTPLRSRWLIVFIVLIVLYIFGTACAIEPIAGLADSYRHSGLVLFYFQHGYGLPHYEADFDWPGAFTLGAAFVGFAGQTNTLGFIRWFPFFIEMMYLPPLLVISRSIGVGRRAGWLGIVLFYTCDWIYQDYFSPQALGYLFLLIALAAVLASWRPRPTSRLFVIRAGVEEHLRRVRSALLSVRRNHYESSFGPDSGEAVTAVSTPLRPRRGRPLYAIRRSVGQRFERSRDALRSAREGGDFSFGKTAIALLAPWRPKPDPPLYGSRRTLKYRYARSPWPRWIARIEGHDALSVHDATQTLSIFGLLGLIFFAMAISHELTPYALILMLFGLLLSRRLGRPELVVLSALFIVGWLSLGATPYWQGHLSNIFGGFGNIGSTLSANVSGRVSGSLVHQLAVETRIFVIGGLYFLAGIGFLRRSTDTRAAEVLSVFPFFILAVQSYVGEGLMRVVLYALPFTAFLAASAVFPMRSGPIRSIVPNFRPRTRRYGRAILWTLALVVVLASAFGTTVARGGNDAFESFSIGELDAVNYVYAHLKPQDTIEMVAPYLPYNQQGLGEVYWDSQLTAGSPTLKHLKQGIIQMHPRFVVLSQSQENWGEIVAGYPKGWEKRLLKSLLADGFHVSATWPTAQVLTAN